MIENTLWVEKYRPTSLEEYIGNTSLKSNFDTYLKSNDIPHLLLHGAAGGGKTTLAKIVANHIADGNYLYINASDENSVDTVRDKIKQFASSMGFGGIKIIILDEADFTTPNFQAALRNVMETFSKNTRFILTCNYVDKIIDPIQSRCQLFNVAPPSKKEVAMLCANILNGESVKFTAADLASIINKNFPDIRKTINALQKNSLTGNLEITDENSLGNELYDTILKILTSESDKNKKFLDIRQLIADSMIRDYNPIFKFLFENSDKINPPDPSSIILIIADSQFKDAFVIDHEINAMSMFIQIINVISK
jgi:replication factor C small subunit